MGALIGRMLALRWGDEGPGLNLAALACFEFCMRPATVHSDGSTTATTAGPVGDAALRLDHPDRPAPRSGCATDQGLASCQSLFPCLLRQRQEQDRDWVQEQRGKGFCLPGIGSWSPETGPVGPKRRPPVSVSSPQSPFIVPSAGSLGADLTERRHVRALE